MIKRVLRGLLGDVAVWRIFRWDADRVTGGTRHTGVTCRAIDTDEVMALPDPLLADQAWYGGAGSYGFAGLMDNGAVAGLCFYWHSTRYSLSRFWPLRDGEAMLMQIVTTPAARGRGVARSLIQHSAQLMAAKGLRTLWARVWITNAPSSAAFAAAGWREVAWVLEINPLRRPEPWRIALRRPGAVAKSGLSSSP